MKGGAITLQPKAVLQDKQKKTDRARGRERAVTCPLVFYKEQSVLMRRESVFSIMSSYYRQMSRYNTPAFFPLILADKISERDIIGIVDNKTFSMR